MEASGDEVTSRDLDRTSLLDLLNNFLVGTETRKKWKQKIRTPPKPSELGPIAAMKFVSTEKQLVSVTALRVEGSMNETVSTNGTIHDNICEQRVRTFDPNYVKVTLLMDAAECNSTAGGGAIGRKLLALRSNNPHLRRVIGDSMEAKPKYLHQSHLIVGGTKER